MRIGIVGAGSIGSLIAGCLSSTECDLLLYGRGLHGAHLTVDGLSIEGVEAGNVSSERWEVLLAEKPLPESVVACCDVVLLTGKSTAFEEHIQIAKHLLHNDGFVCTLANGLGHEEQLVHAFGAHRVLAATTTHGAYRPEPGKIVWAGRGNISFGPFNHHHLENEFTDFLKCFADAGLEPMWEPNGRVLLWNKMLLNIAINPMSGLLGKENGALLQSSLFESSVSVMLEGANVARSEGVLLADDEELVNRLRNVLEQTNSNFCSMLQDIRAGRGTEINSLNAEICRRGEMLGIPTPLNQILTSLIQNLQ